jgi:hypothetical protein
MIPGVSAGAWAYNWAYGHHSSVVLQLVFILTATAALIIDHGPCDDNHPPLYMCGRSLRSVTLYLSTTHTTLDPHWIHVNSTINRILINRIVLLRIVGTTESG